MFSLPSDFDWLSPWSAISPDDRQGIEDELQREMPDGHVLVECAILAVGASDNYDDVLFVTDCPNRPIAAVHLAWSAETDPAWPSTSVYASIDEWVDAMNEEHVEFEQRFTGDEEQTAFPCSKCYNWVSFTQQMGDNKTMHV